MTLYLSEVIDELEKIRAIHGDRIGVYWADFIWP
jgi:hypothetical protein